MLVAITPRAPLSQFISSIWLYEDEASARGSELRLPTGDVDLVLDLRDDLWSSRLESGEGHVVPSALVVGPSTDPVVLDTTHTRETLGVVFKVGQAAGLLGLPLHELRGLQVPLAEVWGSRAAELRERVLAVPSPRGKIETVEQILGERLIRLSVQPHPAATYASARIAAGPEQSSIAELSEDLGLSSRRLEQVFRADVGLTPKAYQRLLRFRRALAHIDDAARVGWADFALECGFADQSHFVNEFRAHAGLTPTGYLASRGTSLNHVPLST